MLSIINKEKSLLLKFVKIWIWFWVFVTREICRLSSRDVDKFLDSNIWRNLSGLNSTVVSMNNIFLLFFNRSIVNCKANCVFPVPRKPEISVIVPFCSPSENSLSNEPIWENTI